MRQEYLDELETLRLKMQKAEAFAEKLPVFADKILRAKVTGEEDYYDFGKQYKTIPLSWGIMRYFYRNGGSRYIMNYPKDKEYSLPLFYIYINSISLFDTRQEFDLYESLKGVDVFFADKLNTTFYVTDENIEAFLEALNDWYCAASDKLQKYRLEEKERELEKQLEATRSKLKQKASAA